MHELKRKRLRIALLAVMVVVASLAATGIGLALTSDQPDSAQTDNAQTDNADEALTFDGSRPPIVGGEKVSELAAAAPSLPFTPISPPALGQPADLYMHPGTQLALRYESPTYGRLWVYQRAGSVSAELALDSYERLVRDCAIPANACEGRWTMVVLKDGTRALLIEGDPAIRGNTTNVHWARSGMSYIVIGPPSAFTAEEAIAVSNLFVAAGA